MTQSLTFKGFIKGVTYMPQLPGKLNIYELEEFDINRASGCGVIKHENFSVGFSKWISPKRTRSYPFGRIYNTYNTARVITVIPVIKDEGREGDFDRIQHSTISWMNLLNVYIVLGYYETAQKNRRYKNKLTKQQFNNAFVKAQISEILSYKQSALHWNKNLFEGRYIEIFKKALKAYEAISRRTKVEIHTQQSSNAYLEKVSRDFNEFKNISMKGSMGASLRELKTLHQLEFLEAGDKANFFIENYLGGVYYLTADRAVKEGQKYAIQESKNSTKGFLPSLSDIKDGLFKLILYSNLDSLELAGKRVGFIARLKLTGMKVSGSIRFPCHEDELSQFLKKNAPNLTKARKELLHKLRMEASANQNLEIEVCCNQ